MIEHETSIPGAPIGASSTEASSPSLNTVGPPSSRVLIVLIVLLAAALRLLGLDHVPPTICQDEAVNAYDAYCIGATGKDHYGTPWPVFFRSFGDYHPGPPIYLQIPFQMLLGMNIWSTRLPDALFGIAHVFLVYLLVRRFYGERAGLWAAGLLAVSPWHIHLTRLAFGIGMSVSLTTLGLWLMSRRMRDDSDPAASRVGSSAMAELAGAGFALGVALWSYHAMRIVVPALLMGGAVLGLRRLRAFARRPGGRPAFMALIGGFALGTAPFIFAWIKTPEQAWARASSRLLLQHTTGLLEAAKEMLGNYCMHFTPSFLFIEGDLSLVQSIPGYGQLHHVYALLLILGLYRIIRRWRSERFGLFLLFWILVAPIPASLTTLDLPSGHCLRASGVLPAYDILAALGIDLMLVGARHRFRAAYRWIVAVTIIAIGLNAAYFEYQFFVRYPRTAARALMSEWKDVFEETAKRQADYDAVMITSRGCGHVGILYLYWSKMDPEAYSRASLVYWRDSEADHLARCGSYFFARSDMMGQVLQLLRPGARLLVAERAGIPVGGKKLAEYFGIDGKLSVILYEVRNPD